MAPFEHFLFYCLPYYALILALLLLFSSINTHYDSSTYTLYFDCVSNNINLYYVYTFQTI